MKLISDNGWNTIAMICIDNKTAKSLAILIINSPVGQSVTLSKAS